MNDRRFILRVDKILIMLVVGLIFIVGAACDGESEETIAVTDTPTVSVTPVITGTPTPTDIPVGFFSINGNISGIDTAVIDLTG